VRIDERTVYEPDALVRRGPPVDNEEVELNDPIVVVEVISPSSQALDAVTKLEAYFRLPSCAITSSSTRRTRAWSIIAGGRRAASRPEA
jgi:Uma2 family endonuclease